MKSENLKRKNFNRIIAPVDGSEGSKKAVQQAILLAKETGKEVVALYVVDTPRLTQTIPPDDISVAWETILKKQGREVLDEIEKNGKKTGVRVVKKLVEGIPDDEIVKEAKKNDIIVMGCNKKSTLDKLLTGSVCEEVMHRSSSPLMVYQIKNEKSDLK
jgi:nucleotide-binding universal stress UspA family protein